MYFLLRVAFFSVFITYVTLLPCGYGFVVSSFKGHTGRIKSVPNHASWTSEAQLSSILQNTEVGNVNEKDLHSNAVPVSTPMSANFSVTSFCPRIVILWTCRNHSNQGVNETVSEELLNEDYNGEKPENETLIENVISRAPEPSDSQSRILVIYVCRILSRTALVKKIVEKLRSRSLPYRFFGCFSKPLRIKVTMLPRCKTGTRPCAIAYLSLKARTLRSEDSDS